MSGKIRLIPIFFFSLFFLCAGLFAQEDFTWTACLEEARRNNPDLISAQESLNQQIAAKSVTASAVYPQVSASFDAATSKTSGATSDSYSYGLSGTQLIFDGFKSVNNINSARESVEAARQGWRFTSSDVRFNLRTAFVNLLRAQELEKVTEEIVRLRRENLELISLRYYSGLEHKGALLTAEANLDAASFELQQARRAIESTQAELIRRLGRKEFAPLRVKGDFSVYDPAREKPDFEALMRSNPALLQAAARKNQAAYDLKAAYGDFVPSLSARAGATRAGSSWPPGDERWNLGLGVSMPIFEGGIQYAQVSQSKALYRQRIADEKSTEYSVVTDLRQSWAGLQDAVETVEVRRKSLEATQERSRIAQAQYSIGFINFDNWIIIEDALVSAKKAFLESQANALLAEAAWIQAKGAMLEYAQ